MTTDPNPKKSPVEARIMPMGVPMPVVRVAMNATFKIVIRVIAEVSLIDVAVARRLNCFVSLSRALIS